MSPSERIRQKPGADRDESTDEDRSENPIDEELSAMAERFVRCERHPATRSQPVRGFDLTKRRHQQHRGGRETRGDQRPQSVEPQHRRQAQR